MADENKVRPFDGSEIAIVGMACRLPGARTVKEFWENLRRGGESLIRLEDEELARSGVPRELRERPEYVRRASVLDDVESFDAEFFGYTPGEARLMDPQHRLFLECAWEAFEEAGYDPWAIEDRVGVFTGAKTNTYLLGLFSNRELFDSLDPFQIALGNDLASMATRVSYKLNLRGPSYALHTACSTSLVAIHLACQSLILGECEMALAGGAAINVPQKKGYLYQPGGILSPDGSCRTFDADAAGSNFGNGVGAVLLKRAEDAVTDGDHVYAVIRGSATNNDGAKKASYTAPGVEGQTEVLIEALACAGVDADTISYVEAHGTATDLGDSIEMLALKNAFRASTAKSGFCALGSVKTNLGHLETAAGVAGVIKTALALRHGEIPPSLHFERPNPKLEIDGSPFYVNTELRKWERGSGPRRAGVSSFGIGSTNAHAILEEPPPMPASSPSRPWQLLVLAARTEAALEAATDRLADHLDARSRELGGADGRRELADTAYTLQVGRKAFARRRAVVCEDLAGAVQALRERSPERTFIHSSGAAEAQVAFLLPGLGDHYVEMGLGLYRDEPVFRAELDRCAELLSSHLGRDLLEVLYPRGTDAPEAAFGSAPDLRRMLGRAEGRDEDPEIAEASRQLDQTYLAQPAVFAVEWALARLWMHWGIRPRAMVGYSLGELVAAALAGVFSLDDALALVARRARLIQDLPAGAMLAVPLSEEDLQPRLEPLGLSLAAVNGPVMTVAAGPIEAVEALEAELSGEGVACRRLETSHAFHSTMLEPVAGELTELVARIDLATPEIPYLSNVTGTWITDKQATDPAYWALHMCRPVRFGHAVGELLRGNERLLLEVGPGQSLGSFARLHPNCDGERRRAVVASMPAARGEGSEAGRLLWALGSLWSLGAVPRWPAFYEAERRRRVPLPTYPFERERHWVEPRFALDEAPAATAAGQEKRSEIRDWFYLPVWEDAGPAAGGEAQPATEAGEPWVVFAGAHGVGEPLARALSELGAAVVTVEPGEAFGRIEGGVYTVRPEAAEDYERLLAEVETGGQRARRFVHLWTATPGGTDPSSSELFRRHQRLGFYSLNALARALGRGGSRGPARIDVVSTQVQDVTGDEPLCPERATVLGPCIVIPQEHPSIRCRHVDLAADSIDGAAAQETVQALLAELAREPDESAVAHRRGNRWVQRFEPHPLEERDGPPVFRKEGIYLITGGLGGIGLALARHLAGTFGARLVLTRRSEMPERDDWEGWLEEHGPDDKTSRTILAVRDLERLGGEVLVASADVAEPEAMTRVVERAQERFGALHGVVHAAGLLAQDSFLTIQQSDGSECERHFRPKVHGLYVLERVLEGVELDFCLLFSSLSAVLGGLGYVGYAAANLFMDFFARHRNRSGAGAWVSVDWDSWHYPEEGAESGGLGTTLVELALTPEEGVETLSRILESDGLRHMVVSTGDLQARLAQWVELRSMRQAAAGLGGGASRSSLPRGQELERRIAGIWGRVLGREEVGVEENFFELGGNSLLGMQLVSELARELGTEVPPVMLFEAPTVAALALRLAPEEPEPVEAVAEAPARRPAGAPASEDVAVIAMVGRFPGARSVAELWKNLCAGRETISFFSEQELLKAGVDPGKLADPHYVKARPILDDVELFDAHFFGYSPRDAEIMDPQHRLFLEAAWELLEEAGYDPDRIDRPVGVYAGASISSYMYNLFGNPELAESVGTFPILIGNEKDSVTTKISYKLNLKGPSLAVQTFCSTSLVATHLACRGLLNRECDMALAGGVSIILPQKTGYEYEDGGIGSRDGHIRAFDAGASGIVFGNGLGLVALKRLEDALADGDQVHAVIKGTAVNNDGAVKAGYTATSVDGQAELVTDVLERTGIDPETIGYMEAHGSGTPLGDPIEVAALTKAFRRHTAATGFCRLGSVKTNLGHLDRTAGVCGLIKTILTVEHGLIPPTLHFERPNPNIDFESSPFGVNTELMDWPPGAAPRRAGVNSLGLGGTNAHALLEQAPEREPSDPAEPHQLLLLSARSEAALEQATDRLADHLERNPGLNLADAAYTLQVGRKAMPHRRIAVCRDPEDGIATLRSRAPDRVLTVLQEEKGAPVTFLLPGVGGQYPGMARGLYQSEPAFRRELDRCAELLEPRLGLDLREILWPEASGDDGNEASEGALDLRRMLGRAQAEPSEAERRLGETRIAHPALFALQYSLARLWMSWGVRPAALVGYSLGEYVAACLAGVLPLAEALELVAERARRIQELPAGAMTAVSLPEVEITGWLGQELSLAAVNGPEQSVVAGPEDAVDSLERTLAERGVACRRLQATHAFHSRMLEPLRESLVELMSGFDLREPRIPYVSNVTGAWIRPEEATDPEYWARHSVSPVRFGDVARELVREPARVLLELGPGQVLGSLLLQHGGQEPGRQMVVLSSLRHSYERRSDRALLLQTLGKLWLAGAEVDWQKVHAGRRRRRVLLPTYPFERRRYWVESTAASYADVVRARAAGASRDGSLYLPSWRRTQMPLPFRPEALDPDLDSWLILADEGGVGEALAGGLRDAGRRVACVGRGEDVAGALDGTPAAVVDLWSLDTAADEEVDAAWDRASEGALLALRSFAGNGDVARPRGLWTVSGWAWDVSGDETLRPASALALAPLRVLPREMPDLVARGIDVVPPANGSVAAVADLLLAEIAGEPVDRVVAYRGGHRWVPELEPWRRDDRSGASTALRSQGVYLITGGLNRRGYAFAAYLAGHVEGVRLILVDPPSGEVSAGLEERRRRRLEALTAEGTEVCHRTVDLTAAADLRELLGEVHERFERIDGVVHAAEPDDVAAAYGLLQEIAGNGSGEAGRRLLRLRVEGARRLAEVLGETLDSPLDFALLVGSMASIHGGSGLIHDAAADLYLQTFAAAGSGGSGFVPWTNVHWDFWIDDESDLPRGAGRGALGNDDDGAAARQDAALDELFRALPASQLIVPSQPLEAVWNRIVTADRNGEPTDRPAVGGRYARPALSSTYVAPSTDTERRIAEIWEAMLGVSRLGVHDSFLELGGDSLLAARLVARMREAFDLELPVRLFFEASTIDELARVVAAMRAEAAAQEEGDLAELESYLDGLSEEEVEAELARRTVQGGPPS